MNSAVQDTLRRRFTAADWAIFAAGPIIFALLAIWVGQDTSWDFRNYHWYNAYAFETGRYALDIAVAHAATYYNPTLDIAYRFCASFMSPLVLLAFLGAVQGLNFSLVFSISRFVLRPEANASRLASAAIATAGVTGGMNLRLLGTTYYDNVLSLLIFAALYGLLRADRCMDESPRRYLPPLLFAGFAVGCLVGLKLVEVFYGAAYAATLLLLSRSPRHAAFLVATCGVAAAVGVALCGGYWFLHLAHETGNPLFPYFNWSHQGNLLSDVDQRDTRYVPTGVLSFLGFPFLVAWDWHNAGDWPYRDARLAIAYIAVPLALLAVWRSGRARAPWIASRDVTLLLVFVAVAYVAWVALFGIYRYAVAMEMLAPLCVVAALGITPVGDRQRLPVAGVLLLVALVTTGYQFGGRVRPGNELIEIKVPPIADPAHSIVLMAGGEPMAYVIPYFPPQVSFLRLDGYLVRYDDGSGLLREMHARVARHLTAKTGALYVLYRELRRTEKVLASVNLRRVVAGCVTLRTNIGPPLFFCPVEPVAQAQ